MSISMIAAIGQNNELGKNNDLIWHFHEDMVFFRKTTTGNTILMGRKTFESLPKALSKRRNIVITRNKDYAAPGAEVFTSVDDALESCKNDNIYIIGGASIYKSMIDKCDKLYLTEIDSTCDSADVYFPTFDKSKYTKEKLTDFEEDGIHFSHILYTKRGEI